MDDLDLLFNDIPMIAKRHARLAVITAGAIAAFVLESDTREHKR